MSTTHITITGAAHAPFRLGDPMFLHFGDVFLGVLDPVITQGVGGLVVHIEAFTPAAPLMRDKRQFGRWILYEICAMLAERHSEVAALSFALVRPIQSLGAPEQQALARVRALERIGARDICIVPRSALVHVVCGVWEPSEANLKALKPALEEQRQLFARTATLPVGRRGSRAVLGRLRKALRKLLR